MVDMIASPFMWGTDGKPRSPAQVKQQRDIAEALLASAPQGKGWASALGEGLKGLSAGINNNQAGIYEQQGLERAGELFAGIGPESDSSMIAAALADPAAIWATPAQSGVAEALLGEQMRMASPDYALDLAYKRAQLDALQNPQPAMADPTSAMQNYEYLVAQGVEPSQAQGMAFGGGGTSINNYGSIPAGYEVYKDPTTGATQMRAIPGGPAALAADEAALAAEAAAAAGEAGQQQTERYGNVVTEDIGRALKIIENDPAVSTGVVGQILSQVGGTPANRVKNLVETVKSNVGFDRLQAMRESSPTGGALGSVTERELSLLTSAIGSLEQSNNSEDLAYNLRRVNKIYMDIIHGEGKWEAPPTSGTTRKTSTGVGYSF